MSDMNKTHVNLAAIRADGSGVGQTGSTSGSCGGPELLVVMPVFNEQECVVEVVREWRETLRRSGVAYRLVLIDDGSTDATPSRLDRLHRDLGRPDDLELIRQPNRGHGQTCLAGYRLAIERGVPFVMQLDSDGQCDPAYFEAFWRARFHADVVYGFRRHRDDGWRRVLASRILRWTLRATAGVWCVDANVPYRLMRSERIREAVDRIGPEFFLANVALAVLLKRQGRSETVVSIRFRDRWGGEPKVKLSQFAGRAWELVRQLHRLNVGDGGLSADARICSAMSTSSNVESSPCRAA